MSSLAKSGIGIILVHARSLRPDSEIERVLLMSNGRIIADGPKDQMLRPIVCNDCSRPGWKWTSATATTTCGKNPSCSEPLIERDLLHHPVQLLLCLVCFSCKSEISLFRVFRRSS